MIARSLWLLVGLLALLGCADATPTYRYRMTVEVDTPAGLRAGSSVIEVETQTARTASNLAGTVIRNRVHGEAAAVDLPGRVLFALLRSEDDTDFASRIMFMIAPKGSIDGDRFLGTFANMLEMTGPIELPATLGRFDRALVRREGRPVLVTFRDLADPTSVELVDPDDLAATFGDGVSLRRITVQMTDDPVTTGIQERLKWLSEYPEPSLDPDHDPLDTSLKAKLHHRDFRHDS